MGKRFLIGAFLLTVPVLGAAAASGSDRGSNSGVTGQGSELRIVLENTDFGTQTYQLSCAPPSGTVPNPEAICAALAVEPDLLVDPGAFPGPCREPAGVRVSGEYRGKPVDADFTPSCPDPTPRDRLRGRWLSFFPTWNRVRVGRGVGPLTLGETRAAVRSLLGKGERGPRGLRVYRRVYRTFKVTFVSLYGVGYDHAGRVDTLISVDGELTIDGHYVRHADPDAREPERKPTLARWRPIDCAGVKLRAMRPLTQPPATIVGALLKGDRFEESSIAIVTRVPSSACAAAGYLRTHKL